MGHVINEHGVAVDPAKVEAVLAWPTPKSTKEVQGFLGLAGYYLKFICQFGTIAAPLTRLLTKDGFYWNEVAEQAFLRLKEDLTSPLVLSLPDFSLPFVMPVE